MNQRVLSLFILLACGTGWGLTQPLSKIAVSTGHGYLGLIVWQAAIGVLVLAPIAWWRGSGLPLGRAQLLRYILIALIGTVLPNSVSYAAAVHLPAGILSILISLVPIFALPLALAIGLERPDLRRFLGVIAGAAAMILLIGPDAALPGAGLTLWVVIAALSPFLYAVEATYVARAGTAGLDPIQLLLGASIAAFVVALAGSMMLGQFINPVRAIGAPEAALILSSVIHALIYASYVWLIGRAGSVFASQVSYVVTPAGIFWAVLLLAEAYSGWVWAALGLMMLGLYLVTPRQRAAA